MHHRPSRRLRAGAASLGVALGVALVPLSGATAAGSAPLVAVGATPTLPANARAAGSLPTATPLTLSIVLRPRDPGAVARFVSAVSDPSSPEYRQYLGRGQFATRFGPTARVVAALRANLEAAGLTVGQPSGDGLLLPVTGSAAAVSGALHVGFARHHLGGRLVYANTTAPLLPATLAGAVTGVVGLNDLTAAHTHLRARAQPRTTVPAPSVAGRGTGGSSPCAAASKVAKTTKSYTWNQIANAYGFSAAYGAGHLGAGVTVALFELEPFAESDLTGFENCFTLPTGATYGTVSVVSVAGGAGSGSGSGEAILDLEDVLGLAPETDVRVYEAPNDDAGLLANYDRIVSDDDSSVISTSWGDCEASHTSTKATLLGEDEVFGAAAAQGQTVYAAAGDTGSEDCLETVTLLPSARDVLAVDDPASQPYVTGTGGTSLVDPTTTTGRTESVWNNRSIFNGAGGGGVSEEWAKPVWQTVTGSPSPTGSCSVSPGTGSTTSCRQVPDVAATADPQHGDVIYCSSLGLCTTSGSWIPIGGTSAAAPLWAALTALAVQGCGTPVGFVDPRLYSLAGTGFNDIVTGTNDYTGGHPGHYDAAAGWDNATGWGTPDAATLLPAICGTRLGAASAALTTTKVGAGGTGYTIHATTSATGALGVGDTVTAVAQVGTGWPGTASDYHLSDGSAVTASISTFAAGGSSSDNGVRLTLGSAVPASTALTLTVTGVTNGTVAGNATIALRTTADSGGASAGYALTAGPASPQVSSVTAALGSVPANGTSTDTLTVTVRDAFGNPLAGHTVAVTGSAGTHSVITPHSAVTSASGSATFTVSDSTVETVSYTATDSTAAITIAAIARIDFTTPRVPQPVSATGYWLAASDGGIFSFGSALFYGSTGGMHLNAPIVGMSPTPDGAGYWLVASDGGIFTFGDAHFYGSTGAIHLNEPILGMATTPDGGGYWLVASDGGIFTFGDAHFFGSTGAIHLNAPIVGMAPTPDGGGYWLVASDGGIFSFGDALFYGSTGGIHLNAPIVGMARTADGTGYWLVASDGGIFSFGDALFYGSTGAIHLNRPIVAMAETPDGAGYWLVASDGGIFSFGDAHFYGSTGAIHLNAPIVGMAETLGTG